MERGLSASECPVCYDGLGPERVPYSLTCGHTVCWICVKRLSEGVRHFSCPLCREKVPISDIKRNVTLLQLITQINQGITTPFSRALSTPFEAIELGRLLDRGASGEVYRGIWQSNDVAIKVFTSGQLSSEAHESFHREVCIMNTLRHPNVVLLLAASPYPPKLAIIMEYVGGGSLYSHLYIDKTILSVETLGHLLADITRGLQYLHSLNILHRDLKSKNVLLTSPPPLGRAKLCDFGLARMRLDSATMTGNIGTVHWTAPEVLNCGKYHFSADIYSLGMVIYEMIARAIPFSNLPPPAVIVAVLIRRDKPVPPADTHPIFLSLFNQCTSWEPSKRPSILSIIRDLTPLIFTSPDTPSDSNKDDIQFNYTDSLGHVTIDLEDDDELLQFIQEQLGGEEEEGVDQVAISLSNERQESNQSGNDNQNVYEDTRGVLSQQELDEYHNDISSIEDHHFTTSNTLQKRRSDFFVPDLVPANSLRSSITSNNVPLVTSTQATPTSEGNATSLQNEMQTYMYDRDRELALQMQLEEQKNITANDYIFASKMQEREQFGYRGPVPPPPPPVPIRTKKLPFSDKKRMVLSQVRRSGYHRRNLKHVEPVEKKAFKVGRVIDEPKEKVFTLQSEIAAFSKNWLYETKTRVPKPPFPVGRVVHNRGRVHDAIRRMNSRTQSQIQHFDKSNILNHVRTDERNILPTKEDISIEKDLLVPTSPPPPPPPGPLPNTNGMKVKSRIISPSKKKGAVKTNYDNVSKSKLASKSYEILMERDPEMKTSYFSKKVSYAKEDIYDSDNEEDEEEEEEEEISKVQKVKRISKTAHTIDTKSSKKEVVAPPQKKTDRFFTKQTSKKPEIITDKQETSSKKVKQSVASKLKIPSSRKVSKSDDDFVIVSESQLEKSPPTLEHDALMLEIPVHKTKKGKKKK